MLDDMRRDWNAWRDQAQARVLPAPGAEDVLVALVADHGLT
jgi:hypothetical protein